LVLCIKDFIKWTKQYFVDISRNIWIRICDRLAIDVSNSIDRRFSTNRSESLELDFKSGFPLEGIIANLSSRFGGNVSDLGIVSVTSQSTYSSDFLPKNAVDLTADSKFGSQSWSNQWLCYDFKDRRVEVRHYSIRSQFNCRAGYSYLKSWVIEGSEDCENWTGLDSQNNNWELNDRNKIYTWVTNVRMKPSANLLHPGGAKSLVISLLRGEWLSELHNVVVGSSSQRVVSSVNLRGIRHGHAEKR
jgi:hypothetical protein